MLKHVGGPGLLAGLRQALAGEMPLSGTVRRALVASVVQERTPVPAQVEAGPELTTRESELLGWLAQGLGNVEIGARMYVRRGRGEAVPAEHRPQARRPGADRRPGPSRRPASPSRSCRPGRSSPPASGSVP